MKIKKLLTCAVIALCCGNTFAANEITSGDSYYIQNVESGLYLCGANNWGTRSTVATQGDLFTANVSDGKYELIDNDLSSGDKRLGTNLFTDSKGFNWTIEAVEGETGVFTIKNDAGYIAQSATAGYHIGFLTEQVAEVSAKAKWYFLTEAEAKAKLAAATQTSPLTASFLIGDANFSRNHIVCTLNGRTSSTWSIDDACGNFNPCGGVTGDATANANAESWCSTFTLTQTLTVPNGVYSLTAQAALTDYTDAYDGADYPVVYANEESTPFKSMEGSDCKSSMGQLSASFTAGKYVVDPVYVEVTDGTLKIGVKGTRTNTWCIWDNFNLTYYGAQASLAELKLAANVKAYRDALAAAKAVDQTAKMGATELSALKTALSDYAESKVVTSSATAESINAAKSALEAATAAANTSAKNYATDKIRRDQYVARATAANVTIDASAFDAAYAAGTLTTELQDLKTSLDTEVQKVIAAYTDKTDAIANAGLDNALTEDDWTATGFHLAGNANFSKRSGADYVEHWTWGNLAEGTITQTITLPAGVYLLTADAQLLQQTNASVIPGGMYIKAGDNKVEITNIADTYAVAFSLQAAGTIEIGAFLEGCTGNWACVDNFQLKALALVEGMMNATVEQNQQAAYNKYTANPSTTNYNALLEAMAAANESVAEYAKATEIFEKALSEDNLDTDAMNEDDESEVAENFIMAYKAYTNSTLVTAAEAEEAYVAVLKAYPTIGADLTDAVENADCANGLAPNAAGWTYARVTPDNWYVEEADGTLIDFGGTMHVNTWSNEGNSDGSEMRTSFTEIWGFTPTKDINVKHSQMTGLKPGIYEVGIQARIRDIAEGATAVEGLNFLANGAQAEIEWTAGTNCYYATITAKATVTDEGTLDFGFAYKADEVNFTWLSFKNATLKYINEAEFAINVKENSFGTFVAAEGVNVPGGATAYTIDSATADGSYVILTEISSGLIGADTPVVIFNSNEFDLYVGFYGKKGTGNPTAGLLTGVYEPTAVPAGAYVLQTKGGEQKFYQVAAGKQPTLAANKAYLSLSSDVKALSLSFDETAINAIDALTSGKAQIYDLNGRQLQKLQKGVNIVNGIKVLVK